MRDDSLEQARLGVLAALHEGDAGLAYRMVLDLMGDGYPFATILGEVVAPIQYESGRRWQAGDYSISDEHISTAAAETLLATLAGAFDQPDDGPRVVVCCAVGEGHTLPGRMAAALLLSEGYGATFLGSSVPADDLEAYLAHRRPDAVVVTCTQAANLLGARAVVEAAHRAGVPVIAGGRAFGATDARAIAIGADAWTPSLTGLLDVLGSWPPDPTATGERAVASLDAAASLVAGRGTAIDSLTDALAGAPRDTSAERSGRLAEEAGRWFDTLVVAVGLQAPDVLREHTAWLAAMLPTLGVEGVTTADLFRALARATDQSGPEVGQLVATASNES